jgi:transposase
MNGIMYVLSTGCQWRSIPKDLLMQAHGVGVMRVQRQQSELLAADHAVHHFEESAVGGTLARCT